MAIMNIESLFIMWAGVSQGRSLPPFFSFRPPKRPVNHPAANTSSRMSPHDTKRPNDCSIFSWNEVMSHTAAMTATAAMIT